MPFVADISYSGTFAGENFRELVENTIFTEKTFMDCSLVSAKDATSHD